MVSRKRTRAVAEETPLAEAPQQQNGLLHEIRNMWEFANLMQYIYTFGKLSKISEDIEIDVRLQHPPASENANFNLMPYCRILRPNV